jgi:hypothetical protein
MCYLLLGPVLQTFDQYLKGVLTITTALVWFQPSSCGSYVGIVDDKAANVPRLRDCSVPSICRQYSYLYLTGGRRAQ